MKNKKSLTTIIEDYKLCIKDNPYGSERSWPNSYIDHFYNNFCNQLYLKNKSPNIMEINQSNKLNLKLWFIFFDLPIINQIDSNSLIKMNDSKLVKYDLIIINDSDSINKSILVSKLLPLLKLEGVIVIENIGFKSKDIIKIFKNHFSNLNLDIFDFRFKKFILNNCLLTIKRYKKDNSFIQQIKSLYFFLIFLLIEKTISIVFNFLKTK